MDITQFAIGNHFHWPSIQMTWLFFHFFWDFPTPLKSQCNISHKSSWQLQRRGRWCRKKETVVALTAQRANHSFRRSKPFYWTRLGQGSVLLWFDTIVEKMLVCSPLYIMAWSIASATIFCLTLFFVETKENGLDKRFKTNMFLFFVGAIVKIEVCSLWKANLPAFVFISCLTSCKC